MKYDAAKLLLLNRNWPKPSQYRKDRDTNKNDSDKKSIGFELPNGRQIALIRNKTNAKIWVEDFGETPPEDLLSEPYARDRPRAGSLKTVAPNVAGPSRNGSGGKPAYYLEMRSESELNKLLKWYSGNEEKLKAMNSPKTGPGAGSMENEPSSDARLR